jgi:penicillin-binding protein 2
VNTVLRPLDPDPSAGRPTARFLAFGLVIVIVVSLLTARLFALQVANGGRYANLATSNRVVLQPVRSTRGAIVDRNGVVLATNVPSYVVKIRPADLPNSRRAEVVGRLAALLVMDPADINVILDSNPGSRFDDVLIASDVDPAVANLLAESSLDLPGVEIAVEARRDYPFGPLVSQVIGYTGPISPGRWEELRTDGYLADDRLGLAGVESTAESILRGAYGLESVERDAQGRRLQVLQTLAQPRAGDSLRLTIDVREQAIAEQALRWAMDLSGTRRGVVIVMDPQSGEILALVSLPTYDDNLFARGITADQYEALLADPDRPLVNHAINAHYPPGSTFKLVTGVAGLMDDRITASEKIMTGPYITIGDTKFWDWNERGWGLCDLYCGFGHSSDTYFYQVAGRVGMERLAYWASDFGFGATTGVELPREVPGVIPTDAWKREALGLPMYPGEVAQAGIGQGYDVVTPLQLINAYAALANGGTLYRPRVIRDVLDPDGNVVDAFEPEVIRQLEADEAVLRTMREASRTVVTIRHTWNLVDLPIVVAGKTGSAEFGIRDSQGRLPWHTWFVGFVPKEPWDTPSDPNGMAAVRRTDAGLIVLAFAYDSRTRGNAATEIAKYYLQLRYDLDHDYRRPDLLVRNAGYGSD